MRGMRRRQIRRRPREGWMMIRQRVRYVRQCHYWKIYGVIMKNVPKIDVMVRIFRPKLARIVEDFRRINILFRYINRRWNTSENEVWTTCLEVIILHSMWAIYRGDG